MTARARTMAEFAAAENAAAHAVWGRPPVVSSTDHKDVAGRIGPYLGSGKTQREVASILGCSAVSVCKALKKIGGSL